MAHTPGKKRYAASGRLKSLSDRIEILCRSLLDPTDMSSAEGRARRRAKHAALSGATAALSKAITVITGLVSVPLTLHYLGAERYGVWLTISAIPSMLAFTDFGIGNGLISSIAEANGRDDALAVRELISSGLASLTLVAAMLGLILGLIYASISWDGVFNLKTPVARAEAGPALAVFLGCFVAALPIELVERVQMGLQRSFMARLWRCAGSSASLLAVLLAINFRSGLPWLVFALSGVPLLATLANAVTFFACSPTNLRPSLSFVRIALAKTVARSGSVFFLIQAVAGITKYSDNFIIARILGAAVVPSYAVPEKIFAQLSGIAMMVLWPLWPAYRDALTRGDLTWIRTTLKTSIISTAVASTIVSALFVFTGAWLVKVWTGGAVQTALPLLLGLGLWKVMECISFALTAFFNGVHRLRLQAVTGVFTGLASVMLEVLMVKMIGVAGAVWATVIAFSLFTVIPWLLAARQEVEKLDS